MKFEALYFIRPTLALRERLSSVEPDVAAFLSEARLWSKQEGGRTTWNDKDSEAQVKMLFLAKLWSEYVCGATGEKVLQECLQDLLGAPPFDEQVFDRWWQVERFEGVEESFEAVQRQLHLEEPHLLTHAGSPQVEAWVSQVA